MTCDASDWYKRQVCKELKRKAPKLAEIEFIPLPFIENEQYENWHTKILRQIRVWNIHTEQVVKAEVTIIQDKAYRAEAGKSESIKAEYTGKSMEFWGKTDLVGQAAIKLANDIRKRWKDEEKSSLTEGEADNKKAMSSLTESNASIKKE